MRLAAASRSAFASSKGTQPMITKFDLAASLLAATSPAFAEQAGMMMIYGHGNTTCAECNTMPEHGRNMVGQWIDGFFTALSLVAAWEDYDDGSPQNPLVMIAAVAADCVENHSENGSYAAWDTANSFRSQRLCRGKRKPAKMTGQGWVCTN
ncbi:MAG: hypothetical protein WBF43_02940 [Methylocella sp.]